jgi:metal-responsive CopG/Arc/MetJ family transcriptional regulator
MKIKTSVTLSKDLLRRADARAKARQWSRSEFIEEAVRAFLTHTDRMELRARDAALLRKHARALNAAMTEVLEFQVLP